MKRLSWLRVSNLVLPILLVSVVMSLGSGHNEDAFSVLCDVLRSAERVLNKTGSQDGPLKEALYGRPGRVLTVENGKVSVKRTNNCQPNRGPVCTYYGGGYSCLAETFPGAILCLCTPGSGRGGKGFCGLDTLKHGQTWSGSGRVEDKENLFQDVWDQVKNKCLYGNGNAHNAAGDVNHLEKALENVRNALKGGNVGRQTFFYLGGHAGSGYCSGFHPSNVCVAYHKGKGREQNTVTIPWLSAMQTALKVLKQREQTTKAKQNAPTKASPLVQTTTHTAWATPSVSVTPNTSAEYKESSHPTNNTEEDNTEDVHSTETAAAAHQPSPTSRSRRSTTEDPTATSSSPEDTSTTDEPGILDPTAAPFSLSDGADLLTPLGLFMAASSF